MKKRVIGFGLVIISILAGAGVLFGFYHYLRSPAVGVVTGDPLSDPSSQTTKPRSLQLVGKYFSLKYPAGFSVKSNTEPTASALESYLLINNDALNYTDIAVEVQTEQDITDNAAYNLRREQPTDYKLSQKTVNGITIPVMTKTNGEYEETAFWSHAGKMLTVSYTTNINDPASMDSQVTALLSSISWSG